MTARQTSHPWVGAIIPDAANREKDDFYTTPPEGTRALLSVERFSGPIWEPACGDGAISRVLEAAGYEVESTDLVYHGYGLTGIDFLMEYISAAPNIVTNPPFKLIVPFVEKALELTTGKVAILARLAFLESERRRKLFEATSLARVWVFSRRLEIHRRGWEVDKGGGGLIAFAWFVWEHGHEGPPVLGWINPVTEADAGMFAGIKSGIK